MLITEYDPNIRSAQNLVKLFIPVNSKDIKSINPKLAQKRDWDVSNKLKIEFCTKVNFYSSQQSSEKLYNQIEILMIH